MVVICHRYQHTSELGERSCQIKRNRLKKPKQANLAAPEANLAAREANLAAPEANLAAPEANLAAREANLAAREANLAAHADKNAESCSLGPARLS